LTEKLLRNNIGLMRERLKFTCDIAPIGSAEWLELFRGRYGNQAAAEVRSFTERPQLQQAIQQPDTLGEVLGFALSEAAKSYPDDKIYAGDASWSTTNY
jgi:hypothetical protein